MSLQSIFFISLSVQAILISFFLVVFIFYFVKLMREIGLINKKFLEAAEESVEVAQEAKEYIGKIGKSITDYFVIKLIDSVKGKKNN